MSLLRNLIFGVLVLTTFVFFVAAKSGTRCVAMFNMHTIIDYPWYHPFDFFDNVASIRFEDANNRSIDSGNWALYDGRRFISYYFYVKNVTTDVPERIHFGMAHTFDENNKYVVEPVTILMSGEMYGYDCEKIDPLKKKFSIDCYRLKPITDANDEEDWEELYEG